MKRLLIIIFIQTLTVVSAQNSFNNNELDYDSVPAFKECSDKTTRLALRNCFKINFNRHISNYYRQPENGVQGAVTVNFNINEYGFVQDIRAVGGTLDMRFNAEFIISHLQRFKPAVKDGKFVMVSYSKSIHYSYRNGDSNLNSNYQRKATDVGTNRLTSDFITLDPEYQYGVTRLQLKDPSKYQGKAKLTSDH